MSEAVIRNESPTRTTTKTTEATIETPGKVAIPAQKFVSFVKSLYQGEVVVEVDNNNLSVKCGKAGLTESVMNVDEFPALPETGDNEGHKINTDLLSSMIKSTAYAVSKDETRPALMGILWEIKPTSLAMIATDAHRLSKVEASFDWGVTEIKDIITDTAGLLHFDPQPGCAQHAPGRGDDPVLVKLPDPDLRLAGAA